MKLSRIFIIFLIVAAAGAGYKFGKDKTQPQVQGSSTRETCVRLGADELINPLVDCEIPTNTTNRELRIFDDVVQAKVDELKNTGNAETIAVYFRDLKNGPWFGIKEEKNFFPASLIKVPLMIAYFKKAQSNSEILSKEIKYEEGLDDENILQHFKPLNPIAPGKTYKVEELLEKMIIDSDNNAYRLLLSEIGTDSVNQVFNNLGIPPPDYVKNENVNSAHDYATFWRVLYNASYLNKEYSQKALDLLTSTNFNQGLVAGIPQDVKVAHKFGNYIRGSQEVQLHDCGIVYYPTKPYLICIMTRGHDVDKLLNSIQDLSKLVYSEIDKQVMSGN